MTPEKLEALLVQAEVFAAGGNLGLRGRLQDGEYVCATGETPDAVLESFRTELETEARRRLGGQWLAVPVAEASPTPGQTRLDRGFVLLPIERLTAGLMVLNEMGAPAAVSVPESARDKGESEPA